ncbi:Unknown protein, partial [Striga hermonthica]
ITSVISTKAKLKYITPTVFEEEYVDIPIGVVSIDQHSSPITVEDTNQDNVREPP